MLNKLIITNKQTNCFTLSVWPFFSLGFLCQNLFGFSHEHEQRLKSPSLSFRSTSILSGKKIISQPLFRALDPVSVLPSSTLIYQAFRQNHPPVTGTKIILYYGFDIFSSQRRVIGKLPCLPHPLLRSRYSRNRIYPFLNWCSTRAQSVTSSSSFVSPTRSANTFTVYLPLISIILITKSIQPTHGIVSFRCSTKGYAVLIVSSSKSNSSLKFYRTEFSSDCQNNSKFLWIH